MEDLSNAAPNTFASVRFVLTDMDETLTYHGRLAAQTYLALERLQAAEVIVIPVTAAPAGWCDQMARMWPVDGVIGENGGLFLRRLADGHGVERRFWNDDPIAARKALSQIGEEVLRRVTGSRLADDQTFRLATLAFNADQNQALKSALSDALRRAGADTTENNLWILGWLGGFDKLAMARRILKDVYALDIDREGGAVAYVGDSTNDAPMFGFFRHTVGVSTVRRYLHELPTPPRWVSRGPGGEGFVELADAVIAARRSPH